MASKKKTSASQDASEKRTKRGASGAGGRKRSTGKPARAIAKQIEEPMDETDYEGGKLSTELGIIVSFALCALFFLSNFGMIGTFGGYLSAFMLGLFGVLGYLAPIAIFIGTCFYLSNRGSMRAYVRLGGSVLFLWALGSMIQLFMGEPGTGAISDYYFQGSAGGLFGGLLYMGLHSVVGGVGTFLILLVFLAIGSVLVTGKSLVKFVREKSETTYEYAREDFSRRRELRAAERQARLEQADDDDEDYADMENVRGVNIASTELRGATLRRASLPAEQPGVFAGFLSGKRKAAKEKDVIRDRRPENADFDEKEILGYDPKNGPEPIFAVTSSKDRLVDFPGSETSVSEELNEQTREMDSRLRKAGEVLAAASSAQSVMTVPNTDPINETVNADDENAAESAEEKNEQDLSSVFRGKIRFSGMYEEPAEAKQETADSQISAASSDQELTDDRTVLNADESEFTEEAEYTDDGEEDQGISAAVRWESDDRRDDQTLKAVFVRRDTRTFEEMYSDRPLPEAAAQNMENRSSAADSFEVEENGETLDAVSDQPYIDMEEADIKPQDPEAYFDADRQDVPHTESVSDESDSEIYTEDDLSYDDYEDDDEDDSSWQDADDEPAVSYGSFNREFERRPQRPEQVASYQPDQPVITATGAVLPARDPNADALLVKKAALEAKADKIREKQDTLRKEADVQAQLAAQKEMVPKKEYVFPPLSLLKKDAHPGGEFDASYYEETAIKLQQTLKNFGVGVTVTNISCGPTVTRYELQPDMGVKVSRILALQDDIKLNLAAADIRIEAPIPGKAAIGIEVPNKEQKTVYLRDLFESQDFSKHKSKVAFAVGKDIGGQTVVTDVAKMPHLLIAGATGSGKSVCINTLIMSIIYKAKPEDVKMIMIDPKVVELSVYNGIPHLLIPVVTDPKKAAGALNWAVQEMTERYNTFAKYNVRDIKGYNARVDGISDLEGEEKPKKMPQIIIIVDELADLMMVAPGDVEEAICRLAQLARAAGIHLVIATQRPSVNVITGVIKANIPSRIAFSVSSGVDSRTIIDMNGAEKLLGKGDMLFYPSGYPKPKRVQGAFVSDEEVGEVVRYLTDEGYEAEYADDIETKINSSTVGTAGGGGGERDAYFEQAARFIIEKDKASIGMLQRMFKIGFNRAARIMDQLEAAGVVAGEQGTKPREILMSMEQFENSLY